MDESQESLVTLVARAEELARAKDWAELAMEINESILNRDPRNVNALQRLITCHSSVGNYSQVRSLCEQILQIDPKSTFAKRRLNAIDLGKEETLYQG
ncbi:MAG: hypothetical protein AAFY11_10185 [Cyanobacteria bacterium J06641_5]